jgi:hypothetical protein
MPKRTHIAFLAAIVISSFLVLKIQLILRMKGQFKKGRKERLQREDLKPPGAFILEPFGKPIS